MMKLMVTSVKSISVFITWIIVFSFVFYYRQANLQVKINKQTSIKYHKMPPFRYPVQSQIYRNATFSENKTTPIIAREKLLYDHSCRDEVLLKIIKKPLILWSTIGRLGNHLFLHATAFGLAQQTNHTATLLEGSPLLKHFPGIKAHCLSQTRFKSLPVSGISEKNAGFYTPEVPGKINNMSHVQLQGYFQSWRYFHQYKDDLRQQFKVDDSIQHFVEANLRHLVGQKLKTISKNSYNLPTITYIGVHVRRTDMNSRYETNRGYLAAPIEYIKKAMDYYKKKYKDVLYIICSDDMRWSASNIEHRQDTIYIHNNSPIYDLATLMLCNHTVITTGTFSWWAGWLAGGQVVYYSKYPRPGSMLASVYNPIDYYPPDWIPMS